MRNLDQVEAAIKAGDADTVWVFCVPHTAHAAATEIHKHDASARADFGTPGAISNYLRGLAAPKRARAKATLQERDQLVARLPDIGIDLLEQSLVSPDPETRASALRYVADDATTATVAERLRKVDADAAARFTSTQSLAAHLRRLAVAGGNLANAANSR